MEVVAINIEPNYPLAEWQRFWKSTGAGDVVWAQDRSRTTVKTYRIFALGTEVIVDRQGGLAFRSDGSAGYGKLRREIEKLL